VNTLYVFGQYAGLSVRAQLQYRAAFLVAAAGQFLSSGVEFCGMWALFDRFGHLQGWRFAEVAFFYAVVNCTFAIADALSSGFDLFDKFYVKTGEFDRLLLRPRSPILQLAGHELALRRVGRLAQGLIVLIWASVTLELDWTYTRIALLLWTGIGGVCFFAALFMLRATLAFWSTETLELTHILSYGGLEAAQYPMSIYSAAFRKFFTFVVPLACVSYFPLLSVLGVPDPLGSSRGFQVFAPTFGVLFLLVAVQFWRVGVRHYTSTGS
jgi:ABC-2 type transport system permease protein